MQDRIEVFRQMLESEPSNTMVMFGLAKEYEKSGDHQKAVDTYKKGIDVSMAHGHPSMANEYRMTLDLDLTDD
jgi:Tfp pilus assembly protein PilF